jgi:putative flippase GtrA
LIFLLTGGFAAVVNFGSRFLYQRWMSFSSAIIVAYLTGMVTAFILARSFVFKEGEQQMRRSVWKFSLVNLVAVGQAWCISLFLAYFLPKMGVNRCVHEISHGVGILVPVFTSYLGHKRWSFR